MIYNYKSLNFDLGQLWHTVALAWLFQQILSMSYRLYLKILMHEWSAVGAWDGVQCFFTHR